MAYHTMRGCVACGQEAVMKKAEAMIRGLLARADVGVDGARPWDFDVHDDRLYARLLRDGVLGLGEAYMDGWWDCEDLADGIFRLLRSDLEHAISPLRLLLPVLKAKLVNMQSLRRAGKDVRAHYDRGNLLFSNMLDKRMTYSCAYWKNADSLDAAQEAKLDLVCRKAGLREGMRIVDIGCGWGSFMKFAAERYGVSALGVTLSPQQVELGREMCAGLPIEIRLQDYRELEGQYDAVISIGMFEHVGAANHRTFMRIARRLLRDDGLFVLHTIGTNTRIGEDQSVDRAVHLSRRPGAGRGPHRRGERRTVRHRGLAQFRRRLRPHPRRVVREFRPQLGVRPRRPLRPAFLPHVEIFPSHQFRRLSAHGATTSGRSCYRRKESREGTMRRGSGERIPTGTIHGYDYVLS
jgi:SAM-dependent methyltransferase